MKIWEKPIAGAQLFTANDYVSACTRQIMCDIDVPEGADCLIVMRDCTVDFDGSGNYEDDWQTGGIPCGKVHNVSTDTEIFYYEFTHGLTPNVQYIKFESPVEVAYWRELKADGKVNIHWTSPENVANAESNKS